MQSHHWPVLLRREPAKRSPTTPLLVLLHGRGADERDLSSLADALPRSFLCVSLRAPIALPEGGYTWFESRSAARPVAKSLHASVTALRTWLDEFIVREGLAAHYLLGFSAGMMMAGAMLLDAPARFSGAVLLSGAMALDSGFPAEPGRLAGLPIFRGSGTFDNVIPAELVAQTDAYLRDRSGAAVTAHSYRRGHDIAEREIADIARWLTERA